DALTGEDGGHQVGERLAGAGAGFDDEVFTLGQGRFHGLGHLHLAGAMFEIRVPLGEGPVPGEKLARTRGAGLGGHRFSSILRRRAAATRGLSPPVEIAIWRFRRVMRAGTMKLHSARASATLTGMPCRLADWATAWLTARSSVAAKTSTAPRVSEG